MCGIIGITGRENVTPHLIECLKRLEYRGYDSAGVATLQYGAIIRLRAEGKIANLEAKLNEGHVAGSLGIGHTRWATHGVPSTPNAHPHATDRVAVVHNGIIENFRQLRDALSAQGYIFESETDTEVIPVLLTALLDEGRAPHEAVSECLRQLEGAFALGILFTDLGDTLFAARRGSPLAIGYGDGEMFLGSDAMALAPLTRRICYLEDGDWAALTPQGATIYDRTGTMVERDIRQTVYTGAAIGKGNYRHFMQKEIYEQPGVIGETLNAYYRPAAGRIELPAMPFDLGKVSRITIIACGTSYYAGLTAKYWLEQIARVPVEIDIASEFRYREAPLPEGGVTLCISQSGETADTLAALRYARREGQHVVSLVNVVESSMALESDVVLRTCAGPEIGVASTKAFTTQLVVLGCLALAIAEARGTIDDARRTQLSHALAEVPGRAAEILNHDEIIRDLAHNLLHASDILYIGRGTSYPIAMEGALKLKETSYIHAEGYAAGELKHGPIALVDEDVPVIVLAPDDPLFDKTASNLQEVAARDGRVILIAESSRSKELAPYAEAVIPMPAIHPFVAPILYAIPVQLLAYHVAVLKGTDVDQPRNLAKSVTVE